MSTSKSFSFQLLRQTPVYLRLDVLPIAVSAFALYYNFGGKIFDREELVPVLSFMAAIMFHSLLFFVNFWSADLNVFIGFSKLRDDQIDKCTHIWVRVQNVKQDSVKRHIVPILNTSVEIVPGKLESVQSIEVLKKRMLWNNDKKTFQSIPYPVRDAIEHYQTAEGFADRKDVSKANLVWGSNKMHIPIPTFMDLYKEHVVAPFFVFQLFCTLLWLLDEYWYYSLFNLGMLFFFEGTVVVQRRQNLQRLRSMRKPPQ